MGKWKHCIRCKDYSNYWPTLEHSVKESINDMKELEEFMMDVKTKEWSIPEVQKSYPNLIAEKLANIQPMDEKCSNLFIVKKSFWLYKLLCKIGIHNYAEIHTWGSGIKTECIYCGKVKK